jgi:hypothetical protein
VKQVLIKIQRSPITNLYEKETYIDFFESLPQSSLQNWFASRAGVSCDRFARTPRSGAGGAGEFDPHWEPALCSDLMHRRKGDPHKYMLLAVNESWLPEWICALWQGAALYYAVRHNKTVLWVGHQECLVIYSPWFFW